MKCQVHGLELDLPYNWTAEEYQDVQIVLDFVREVSGKAKGFHIKTPRRCYACAFAGNAITTNMIPGFYIFGTIKILDYADGHFQFQRNECYKYATDEYELYAIIMRDINQLWNLKTGNTEIVLKELNIALPNEIIMEQIKFNNNKIPIFDDQERILNDPEYQEKIKLFKQWKIPEKNIVVLCKFFFRWPIKDLKWAWDLESIQGIYELENGDGSWNGLMK